MAGRPRKLLKNSTGDLTTIVRVQKMAEEEAISGRDRELLDEEPPELRDKYARETWQRILPDLLDDTTICNLDRDNIIGYCNSWSEYQEAVRKLKRNRKNDSYQSLWYRRLRAAAAEQRRYGALIGMNASARLKRASSAVEDEQKTIRENFGVAF
jgi:P27 family predicted phage terminase small subunit